MYRVSDEQIEFILNDIKHRGVEMEDLQLNLLDHICCILEQELTEKEDFETTYQRTIKQFFKHELWEIEEETIFLLKYKNYYKMKRLLYILLFLSIGYNVFMLSRMGYEFYRAQEWKHEYMNDSKSTFKDGLKELESKLKEQHPDFKRKKYLAVYYMGGPIWHEHEMLDEDTTVFNMRKTKEGRIRRSRSADSLAGIYNEEISHVFCYETHGQYTNQLIAEVSPTCKNVLFITGAHSLISGYFNEQKNKLKYTPKIFVLDQENKMIYNNKFIETTPHIPLSKFFKTLSK